MRNACASHQAYHVNAVVQHSSGHRACQGRVPEHDWHDGVGTCENDERTMEVTVLTARSGELARIILLTWPDVEACRCHLLPEVGCVRLELVAQLRASAEQIEHGEGGSRDGRRQGVAEQVGPCALAQQRDQVRAPGRVAACKPGGMEIRLFLVKRTGNGSTASAVASNKSLSA